MLTKQELKQRACAAIEQRSQELISVSQDILSHPEPGYSETRTSRVVSDKFTELGIPHDSGLALTGVKGRIQGEAGPGPRVAVIGELDSLIVGQGV